jgi:hypothetical protein
MALPDLDFFLKTPYSKEWREDFKDYFTTLENHNEALYHLTRFSNHLKDIHNTEERTSKGNSVANRLHELKKKVYFKVNNIPEDETIDKVGCVLVRYDDKALYTTTVKDDKTTLGFPKGQYEYKLRNPNDIYSVYGEGYANGALRELQEETGFEFTGKINVAGGIYTGVLERKIHGKTDILPILGGSYTIIGDRFYLIIYVQSTKNLETNAVPDNTENISGVKWEHQYTEDTQLEYNSFSKQRFEYPGELFFRVENNSEHLNFNINSGVSSAYFMKRARKQKYKTKKAKRPSMSPKKRSKAKSKKRGF